MDAAGPAASAAGGTGRAGHSGRRRGCAAGWGGQGGQRSQSTGARDWTWQVSAGREHPCCLQCDVWTQLASCISTCAQSLAVASPAKDVSLPDKAGWWTWLGSDMRPLIDTDLVWAFAEQFITRVVRLKVRACCTPLPICLYCALPGSASNRRVAACLRAMGCCTQMWLSQSATEWMRWHTDMAVAQCQMGDGLGTPLQLRLHTDLTESTRQAVEPALASGSRA